MDWTRRTALLGLATLPALGFGRQAHAIDAPGLGIGYLEALGQPGALTLKIAYLPPSRIDPAYSHAIYVNAALHSDGGQKMWVIERNGGGWRLALWDEDFWSGEGVTGTPPYSWPVSTGRKYPGDKRSGPTPLGIFNPDDRAFRHRPGWGSPGMYNSIYIDLHYGSGRASGVAMHGTPRNKYRLLGRADSHGCIRMEQENADKVWAMFHGTARPGRSSPLWSEVPRYFKSPPSQGRGARWGYVRDGTILHDAATGARLTKPGYSVLFVFFRDDD
ncbi:MAG: L,D-transpeptidase family protein [Rhodobacter sp.]|nr:L,D-transpeptidase family protein [Rhodobacter sp.]